VDLTHPPIFYAREPNQLLDFVLLTRGFRRHRHEVTDVIPLTGGWNAVSARWDASARKGVRRAREQGVQVQVSDDLGTFYPMLEESRRQHGTAPTHSRKDLERLFELVPGRVRLLLATSGGSPVGGVFLMQCNPRVVMNFYLCHREDAAGLRPADALMEASLRAAVEWGATYYDLGTSSIGGVPNPGLLRFKGKWGTSPFLRETYRKEIEPS
jgi:lipid II:glycine glycyltransferase (peptidoglycan interpeptide bridge formation enzyme)